jgi:plastocyanin
MRPVLAPCLLLALVVLAIPHAPALPAGPVVVAAEFQYAPQVVIVPLGTPVTFLNPSVPGVSAVHTWTTAASLDAAFNNQPGDLADTNCQADGEPGEDADPDTCSLPMPPGASHEHTYQQPGTYVYYCMVHYTRKMAGLVQVA